MKTFGGWKKPAPVDRWFIPVFIGFQMGSTMQGDAGFRNHPQYEHHEVHRSWLVTNSAILTCLDTSGFPWISMDFHGNPRLVSCQEQPGVAQCSFPFIQVMNVDVEVRQQFQTPRCRSAMTSSQGPRGPRVPSPGSPGVLEYFW